MTTHQDNFEHAKVALEHAWDWFALHATQRLQSVNFFLVATAFLSAAFVTAAKEKMYVLAGGVAILAALISYFFYRMERRIRSLIHAAEAAIAPLQQKLSGSLDINDLTIIAHVEEAKPGEWKYSKVFRYLYLVTGMAFILGLFYVTWAAFSTTPDAKAFNVVVQAVVGVLLITTGYEMLTGLPKPADKVRIVSHCCLILIGTISGLAGILIICHLVLVKL